MLDGRKMRMIELKLREPTMSNAELARQVGVSRQSIWEWSRDSEVKAELDRRLQSINQAANYHLRSRTNDLMNEMLDLALSPTTEQRTKNSALQYLLDRSMGKAASQIDLNVDDGAGDVADTLQQFREFLEKNQQLKGDDENV